MTNGVTGAACDPISLYVHIPFCETKCPYCDFNTYAGIEPLMPSYLDALVTEVALWGGLLGHPRVTTVFFGGGTPSYLPAEHIARLMEAIGDAFDVEPGAEVTLESNPGDFTPDKLATYRHAGVNRLSIGVQSLDDRLLGVLGRRHSAQEALEAYRMAQDAGFDNISIDLMFGLPYQGLDDWRRTLDEAARLEPKHVSMYCLTLEEGTPLERWVRLGQTPEPNPDLAADMYQEAQEVMRGLGYRHYEISNWAAPGFESRHNLTYWRNQPYLGVGPGAHSYLSGFRFANLRSPRRYVERLDGHHQEAQRAEAIDAGTLHSVPVVDEVERIEHRLEMAETLMMGLRLDTGVGLGEFQRRFGETPSEAYGDALAELSGMGLLETVEGALRLTPRGRMLGNEVFSRFFA